MRKLFFLLLLVLGITTARAQIFNTSSTLGRGNFSAGVEPAFFINGGNDFYLFLHGGVGITKGTDFGLKLGVLGGETYFGGDVEFQLGSMFSLSAGAHSFGDFGLDFTGLFTFPLVSSTDLFIGLDTDIMFGNDVYVPLWLPVGVEIGMNKNMAFIFEAGIRLTDVGYHYIGGGLNFYF